jgi:hypothetical protein
MKKKKKEVLMPVFHITVHQLNSQELEDKNKIQIKKKMHIFTQDKIIKPKRLLHQ